MLKNKNNNDIAKQYITTYMDRKNFADSIFCQPCALSIK